MCNDVQHPWRDRQQADAFADPKMEVATMDDGRPRVLATDGRDG